MSKRNPTWAEAGFTNVGGAEDAQPTPVVVIHPGREEFWWEFKRGFRRMTKFLVIMLLVGFVANLVVYNNAPHPVRRPSPIPAARPLVLPAAAKVDGHPCVSKVGGRVMFTGCRTRYR